MRVIWLVGLLCSSVFAESKFSFEADLTHVMDSRQYNDFEKVQESHFESLFFAQLTESFLAYLYLDFQKNHYDEFDSRINDGILSLNQTIIGGDRASLGFTLDNILPLSEASREIDEMQYGAELGPNLTLWLNKSGPLWWNVVARPRVYRNYFAADRNIKGEVLKEQGFVQDFRTNFMLYETLRLRIRYTRRSFTDTLGENPGDAFRLEEKLYYKADPNVEFFLGHTLSDSVYNGTRTYKRVRVFDVDRSMYFFGVMLYM